MTFNSKLDGKRKTEGTDSEDKMLITYYSLSTVFPSYSRRVSIYLMFISLFAPICLLHLLKINWLPNTKIIFGDCLVRFLLFSYNLSANGCIQDMWRIWTQLRVLDDAAIAKRNRPNENSNKIYRHCNFQGNIAVIKITSNHIL